MTGGLIHKHLKEISPANGYWYVDGIYSAPDTLKIAEYRLPRHFEWHGDMYTFRTKEEAEEAIATAKLLKGLT